MSAPARTVVLGGTGYIGATVTRLLRRRGPVVSVSRGGPVRPGDDHLVADLSRPVDVERAVEGADVVICTAGFRSESTQWRLPDAATASRARSVNVDAIRHVVTTLRRRDRRGSDTPLVIFASTMAVHDGERSGYAQQKAEAEEVLAAAAAADDLRAVSLRLSTVFGVPAFGDGSLAADPGHGVVASWARRAVAGEPLSLWNGGETLRDLVHVEDVARAIDSIARHPGPVDPVYEVGSGEGTSLRWIAEQVSRAASKRTGRTAPVREVAPPGHAASSDLRDVVADVAPLSAATGWLPRTDKMQAIADVVAQVWRETEYT